MTVSEPNLDAMLAEQPDDTPGMKEVRAALRRANERNSQLESDAAKTAVVNKENAFLKAGVNPATSPMAQFLYDNYAGELDATAIQAKAAELGVTPTPTSEPAPPDPTAATSPPPAGTPAPPPPDPTQTQQRNALAGETAPSELPSSNPVVAGYEKFHAELAAGATREDAAGTVLGEIIGAANAGDQRFIFDPHAWANQPGAADR